MTFVLRIIFFLGFMLVFTLHGGLTESYVTYRIIVRRFNLEFSLAIDCMAISRVCLVLFISGCVFLFSHVYIRGDASRDRFILLLAGFVLSMIILLISRRIPLLLVGWDGLGVTSFLLIVYYDRKTNNRSGIVTFGVNRFGDAVLIRTLIFFSTEGSIFIGGKYLSLFLVVSYMLVSLTKRAQYPFSMWLPLAIDAPTPVSALVHRRTLVTAGLFLIARIIPESYNPFLLLIGGVTLCVGRFCAVFSTDLKKLIANSTLSNLGLIAFILSMSDKTLIVFHLYTHALFKAGLFITAGAMLTRRFGVQDRRGLYGGGKNRPFLGTLLTAFFVSSIGLFFLSTFFSKHQIALIAQMISVNILSLVMIGLGVLLTTLYRMRLSYIIVRRKVKIRLMSGIPSTVLASIGVLALTSIGYGNFARSCLLRSVFCYEIPINYIVLLGIVVFLFSGNTLSRNIGKRILQIDTIMDLTGKLRGVIDVLQCTDIGYGRVESKGCLERINAPRSLIVGTMWPNRVNLRIIFIRLCSILLFL